MRIDPYPIAAGKPLRIVFDWIATAREMMREIGHDVPLTVILQTWNSGEGNRVEIPSIPQLRAMAYLAMFSEVDTLSFFDFNPREWDRVPAFRQEFQNLMTELKAIAAPARTGFSSPRAATGIVTTL